MYVIDLSGSTLDGPGCGGDRNHDGRADTPLDCEIAAATALNAQAVENGTVGKWAWSASREGRSPPTCPRTTESRL